MIDSLEKMIQRCKDAAELIKLHKYARIVSHNDCDGICAASIISKAMMAKNIKFHLTLAKYLDSEAIESLAEEQQTERWKLLILTDLGSGKLQELSKLSEKCKIIITDHHQIEEQTGENKNIVHINPLLFGLTQDISGSGVTYILARTLDAENIRSGDLAIVGAIGDIQTGSIGDNWTVLGLNQEILADAKNIGVVKVVKGIRLWGRFSRPIHKALEFSIDPYIPGISGNESAAVQFLNEIGIALKNSSGKFRSLSDLSQDEQKKLISAIIIERLRDNRPNPTHVFGDAYELTNRNGELRDAQEFATLMNSCGKSLHGYLGVAVCLGDEEKLEKAKEVMSEYRRKLGMLLDWVFKNKDNPEVVRISEYCAFIIGGDRIDENLISTIASIAQRSDFFNKKVVVGFGNAESGKVKVSVRSEEFDLNQIVRTVVAVSGGEAGGHEHAAGATIPCDKVETFIAEMEKAIKNASQTDTNAV